MTPIMPHLTFIEMTNSSIQAIQMSQPAILTVQVQQAQYTELIP